jgi:hypothetical protein
MRINFYADFWGIKRNIRVMPQVGNHLPGASRPIKLDSQQTMPEALLVDEQLIGVARNDLLSAQFKRNFHRPETRHVCVCMWVDEKQITFEMMTLLNI